MNEIMNILYVFSMDELCVVCILDDKAVREVVRRDHLRILKTRLAQVLIPVGPHMNLQEYDKHI